MTLTTINRISFHVITVAMLFLSATTQADDQATSQIASESPVKCGSLSKKVLKPNYNRPFARIDGFWRGDTNFGGTADYKFTVKSSLQRQNTQIEIGIPGFVVKECCSCNNPDFLCGVDENNSHWAGGPANVTYSAPADYVFEEIYEGSASFNERTHKGDGTRSKKVVEVSSFPHLKEVQLTPSAGTKSDTVKMGVAVVAPDSHEFILRRVSNCLPSMDTDAAPRLSISGSTTKNSKYVIVNTFHKNMVLDASAGDKSRLQLWNLEGDNSKFVPNANNQKWVVKKLKNGLIKLSNSHYKNYVLDASAGTKGKVQLFKDIQNSGEYVPNALNQKWKLEPSDNGSYKIRNAFYKDMVLDASASDLSKIQLWDDIGDADTYVKNAGNQKWYLIPVN